MSAFRARGRGGNRSGRGGGNFASRKPQGLFANGAWQCDCNPRLPAIHFQVKKDGPNKGRWFYTCQQQRDEAKRCKFFLWDDDAKTREEAALLNNSRTEPSRSANITPSRARNRPITSPPPPYTLTPDVHFSPDQTPHPEAEATPAGRKRTRLDDEEEAEDEYGLQPGDSSFNEELERIMGAVETPRKAARTDMLTTPGRRKLPWMGNAADGLPTPQTDSRDLSNPFQTRFASPGRSLLTPTKFKSDETEGVLDGTPAATPTPSRFKDAGAGGSGDDIIGEVTDVLQEGNIALNEATKHRLDQVLTRYAMRYQGIAKGRELSRAAIKAKEAKITELQYRVNTLEAELEAERALVKHLRWEAETGQET